MHSAGYHDQQAISIQVIMLKMTVEGAHYFFYKIQNFTIKDQYLGVIIYNMNIKTVKITNLSGQKDMETLTD